MSDLNQPNVVFLTVKQFPQNLIIPGEKNKVLLQINNHSDKQERFLVEFEGENLEVTVLTSGFESEVTFNAGQTKDVELNIIPKADGSGKVIINVYWIEEVKYVVKVQKIREKASSNNIKKILKNKNFLSTEVISPFHPEGYYLKASKDEIKQIEKNIKILKQGLNNDKLSNKNLASQVNELDNQIKQLAKAYLYVDDFYKALETSLEISNEDEKITFYYDLLRAYANHNFEATLEVVRNLGDIKRKDRVLIDISIDLFEKKPEEIFNIVSLIDSKDFKEKALLNIIKKAIENNNVQLALKYSQVIEDPIIRVKTLFNIVKSLNDNNNKDIILPILGQINQLILNSDSTMQSDKKGQNTTFELLKASICIIAELDCPESADSLIKDIKQEDIRNKVAKDLFDEIYELVDETKTRLEKKVALSQFYSVNMYSSQITRDVKNFSLIGGNVSDNILIKSYDVNFALISLFSFNFSIFPIIDRLYFDFKFNSKKSFAYYIFPSISNHDEEELNLIKQTLNQFFNPSKISNQMLIFNLDFVPYLGKPTVILAEDQALTQNIKIKLENHMGGEAEILINEDFFKGGQAHATLKSIFQARNFSVINLILSYEFLNNYDVFKLFIEALI